MADVLGVLIVGGGAAGYTAGIFAARDGCRALLLEKFSPTSPASPRASPASRRRAGRSWSAHRASRSASSTRAAS